MASNPDHGTVLRIGAAIARDAEGIGFRAAIERASSMLGISEDAARCCAAESLRLARAMRQAQ